MPIPIMAAFMGMQMGQGALSMYPPLQDKWSRIAYRGDPAKIPGIGDLVDLRLKGLISPGDFDKFSKENGFPEEFSQAFLLSQAKFLAGIDYITAWRREIITEEQLNKDLESLGIPLPDQEILKRVSEYFPTAGDLVRFAVREVYNQATADKFGMYQDIPQEYLKQAKKAGLPEEQARWYWAAHWELPSINQGFEMLHRDIIDPDTLNQLLIALDVMPYWRDRLIQLSYNPLTRVDVRRMYSVGTLNKEGVLRSYLDIGYSPDNAELMTDFTIKYESKETDGLTRASVVSAYKKGIITEPELRQLLEEFGYSEEVIQFWVDMAEWEKAYEEITRDLNELVNQYRLGKLTISQVQTELYKRDIPAELINSTVRELETQPTLKLKMPSKTDLETWLVSQVIDEEEFTSDMRSIGYEDRFIQNYLTQYELENVNRGRKFLSETVYSRWLKKGIMTEDSFRETLTQKGLSIEDIDNLVIESEVD